MHLINTMDVAQALAHVSGCSEST